MTTATIVNIAGSCENPYASFPLECDGEAYLSKSAQLQLEPIVVRLERKVFSSGMNVRAESFDDPENPGPRLSELNLAETELMFENHTPDEALTELSNLIERFIKYVIFETLGSQADALKLLGSDFDRLAQWTEERFHRLTWDQTSQVLYWESRDRGRGENEERGILQHFGNTPSLLSQHQSESKFLTLKVPKIGLSVSVSIC